MTQLADFSPGPDAPEAPAALPARIVGAYGYRVEGDTACLNAEIDWSPAAADTGAWSLQLWACPVDRMAGEPDIQIAELPVAVPLHTHGEPLYVEGYVMAVPPAGAALHMMELRLVSTDRAGALLVHDSASFGQPEQFVQPRLQGVALSRDGEALALRVEQVLNPRPQDNLSGSLAVELWALPVPYNGGAFEGLCIASVSMGEIGGQGGSGPVRLAVPAAPDPAAPSWCLMLREWTAVGYVTRDYVAVVPPAAEAVAAPAAEVAEPVAAAVAAPVEPPQPVAPPAVVALPVAPAAVATAHRPRPVQAAPAPVALPGLGARLMANLRQFLQR